MEKILFEVSSPNEGIPVMLYLESKLHLMLSFLPVYVDRETVEVIYFDLKLVLLETTQLVLRFNMFKSYGNVKEVALKLELEPYHPYAIELLRSFAPLTLEQVSLSSCARVCKLTELAMGNLIWPEVAEIQYIAKCREYMMDLDLFDDMPTVLAKCKEFLDDEAAKSDHPSGHAMPIIISRFAIPRRESIVPKYLFYCFVAQPYTTSLLLDGEGLLIEYANEDGSGELQINHARVVDIPCYAELVSNVIVDIKS